MPLLAEERGEAVDVDLGSTLDWEPVRAAVRAHGMRNSNTMAIAPTATISNIQGVSQSIEPLYTNLYVKSNLSGEFTVVNERLVRELTERGLWDAEMLDDLKYDDGSVQGIARIPDEMKERYPTAFEIDPSWLIACAARRQKWIDMGQSLNLYVAEPSGRVLSDLYRSPGDRVSRRPTTSAPAARPRPRNRRSTSTAAASSRAGCAPAAPRPTSPRPRRGEREVEETRRVEEMADARTRVGATPASPACLRRRSPPKTTPKRSSARRASSGRRTSAM